MRKSAKVVIMVGAFTAVYALAARQDETPPAPTATMAFVMCQRFVKDRLKAPSTAKFPHSYSEGVITVVIGNGAYRVVAYVDAQNSFGAMLRSPYTCSVKWTGQDSWQLIEPIRLEK